MDRDPLDELRRANPVDRSRLPSDSLARLRAQVSEVTVEHTPKERRSRPARPTWLASAALAAIVVVAAFVAIGPLASPAASPSPSGGPISASCVEQYSLDTIGNRGLAFDGTLASVDGDQATFSVNQWYRGPGGATVTLTAEGMTGTSITSAGGPDLAIGERYLVAGEPPFVWACGFTQPYDAAVAADWAAAFGG